MFFSSVRIPYTPRAKEIPSAKTASIHQIEGSASLIAMPRKMPKESSPADTEHTPSFFMAKEPSVLAMCSLTMPRAVRMMNEGMVRPRRPPTSDTFWCSARCEIAVPPTTNARR